MSANILHGPCRSHAPTVHSSMRFHLSSLLFAILCTLWLNTRDATCSPILYNSLVKKLKQNHTVLGVKPFKGQANWPCMNGGKCHYGKQKDLPKTAEKPVFVKDDVGTIWGIWCTCPPGTTGQFCEILVSTDPCNPNPCRNGGTCQIITQNQSSSAIQAVEPQVKCICSADYTGHLCEISFLKLLSTEYKDYTCKEGILTSCQFGRCLDIKEVRLRLKQFKDNIKKQKYMKDSSSVLDNIGSEFSFIKKLDVYWSKLEPPRQETNVCYCDDGVTGLTCSKSCSKVRGHGPHCRYPCGHCAGKEICDSENGYCDECDPNIPGLLKPYCKDKPFKCIRGLNCMNGKCDDNEVCRCDGGYTGDYCDQQCSPGYCSRDCASQCSPNCKVQPCRRTNCVCEGGCKDGWTGELCDKAPVSYQLNYNASYSVTVDHRNDIPGMAQVAGEFNQFAEMLQDLEGYMEDDDSDREFDFLRFAEMAERLEGWLDENESDDYESDESEGDIRSLEKRTAVKAKEFAKNVFVGTVVLLVNARDKTVTGKVARSFEFIKDLKLSLVDDSKLRKRQAGGPTLKTGFTMIFHRGSVAEKGLKEVLLSNLKKASDEVDIPGVRVDKNSFNVQEVNIGTVDEGEDSHGNDLAVVGGVVAGVLLLMAIMVVILVVINKKNKKRKVLRRPNTRISSVYYRSRSGSWKNNSHHQGQ